MPSHKLFYPQSKNTDETNSFTALVMPIRMKNMIIKPIATSITGLSNTALTLSVNSLLITVILCRV